MSFITVDNLINLVENLDLSSIGRLCSSSPQINTMCRNNELIRQQIYQKWDKRRTKRIKDKTDEFLRKYETRSYSLFDQSELEEAIINGDVDIVDELISRKYDPTLNNNKSIKVAAIGGNMNIVNRLLEHPKVDPSVSNNYAIGMASSNNRLDVVNRLLEDPRVDPSDDDNFALRLATEFGHVDVINRLLQDPRVRLN